MQYCGLVSHFLKFSLGLVQVCIHPKSGHPGRPDSAKKLIFRKKMGGEHDKYQGCTVFRAYNAIYS